MSVMAALHPPPDRRSHRRRRLFVGWQDPKRRSIEPVAVLTQVAVEPDRVLYYFGYLRRALKFPEFQTFTAFPDIYELYVAERLFPFFENRTLSRKRADFPEMMRVLDLRADAEPFEVLGRSGGKRETDRLEVFPEPEPEGPGRGRCLFFARGLRYQIRSDEVVAGLERGASLRLLQDLQNPVNPRALLLADSNNQPFGFLPDYLVGHVHDMLRLCGQEGVAVTVEHVNAPATPRHMRVLCRLTSCWPEGYQPFSDDGYEQIAPLPPT